MKIALPEQAAPWRARLWAFMESAPVNGTLIALIVLNAVVLGMETSDALMARWGAALVAIDRSLLAVFVVEIAVRIAVHRAAFFRDPWSVFDFLVVAIALIPASGPFAVLRALRVLRVLRLLTMVPSMRRVVAGLLAAIPGLGSVAAIIAILFYVSAVIATKLFGDHFPELFGSLPATAFTLFQVMTLEGWSGDVVRPVMAVYPQAWVFFITFILISTFTMLNLFVAIIVGAMHGAHEAETARERPAAAIDAQDLHAEIGALRRELAELRDALREREARAAPAP